MDDTVTSSMPPVNLLDYRSEIIEVLRVHMGNLGPDTDTILVFKEAFMALPGSVQYRMTFADFLFHLLEFQEDYGISFKLEPHPSLVEALKRMAPLN